jgi:hypothetical protein
MRYRKDIYYIAAAVCLLIGAYVLGAAFGVFAR